MEEKKYLNEENYQRAKNKIIRVSLIILIVALLIGGGLITTGIIKLNDSKKISEKNASDANKRSSEISEEIESIEAQISNISLEIGTMENEKSKIFMESGFSDSYYEKDNEIEEKHNEKSKLQKKLSELETEQFKVKNTNYKLSGLSSEVDYEFMITIGGFIVLVGLMLSLSVYFIAKRREILAFSAQQVIPVGKEIIEDVAPTVGNAASEIAKGIKQGLNDDEK